MKRFFTIMLGVLLIAAITAPALAWEFALTGEAEWRTRYFARQGQADLFGGPAGFIGGVATGVSGFAGPVANTVLVQGFSAKGADASIGDSRVWLYPEFRVNPAIRLRGEYWVTGGNWRAQFDGVGFNNQAGIPADNFVSNLGYNGWYVNWDGGFGTAPGGMSMGLWEKFWLTAQTPWGIFAVGRRPFPFGLGWSTLHAQDANSESWLIAVPYGPLTFIYGQNLREVGDTFAENSFGIVGEVNAAPAFAQVNATRRAMGTDKNRARNHNGAFAITYRNGPMEFGSVARYISWDAPQHALDQTAFGTPAGPAGADDFNAGALSAVFLSGTHLSSATTPIYGDIGFVLWVTYLKYNNGRFFANFEYDFEYGDWFRRGGRPLSMWADAWEVEVGAFAGPAKLSLVNFYSSGQDRRGGLFSVPAFSFATGTFAGGVNTYDRFSQFLVFGGRQKSIDTYQFLLGIYGGGNNAFDGRGYATFTDFLGYAARLDYAVAANLNVFGSFMYANRASNTATPIASFSGLGGAANARAVFATLPGGAVPNVPDNYLGWEGDVGVNWKLLEGLTFNGLFAYWAPGDWFKWAYVDYSNLNTVNVSGLNLPVNPNRGIDPIIGFQGSVVVDF